LAAHQRHVVDVLALRHPAQSGLPRTCGGENVTTRGLDLLAVPIASRLSLGEAAVVAVTGLRDPWVQLDHFRRELMTAVLDRDEHGNIVRKAGVMGLVHAGGEVLLGDPISVELPPSPHMPLTRV
jgi:MOSC domain-containing protein YiiM